MLLHIYRLNRGKQGFLFLQAQLFWFFVSLLGIFLSFQAAESSEQSHKTLPFEAIIESQPAGPLGKRFVLLAMRWYPSQSAGLTQQGNQIKDLMKEPRFCFYIRERTKLSLGMTSFRKPMESKVLRIPADIFNLERLYTYVYLYPEFRELEGDREVKTMKKPVGLDESEYAKIEDDEQLLQMIRNEEDSSNTVATIPMLALSQQELVAGFQIFSESGRKRVAEAYEKADQETSIASVKLDNLAEQAFKATAGILKFMSDQAPLLVLSEDGDDVTYVALTLAATTATVGAVAKLYSKTSETALKLKLDRLKANADRQKWLLEGQSSKSSSSLQEVTENVPLLPGAYIWMAKQMQAAESLDADTVQCLLETPDNDRFKKDTTAKSSVVPNSYEVPFAYRLAIRAATYHAIHHSDSLKNLEEKTIQKLDTSDLLCPESPSQLLASQTLYEENKGLEQSFED